MSTTTLLQLLVEAILYYVACALVARSRADAPGFLRVLITVLLVTLVSGSTRVALGEFWSSSVLVFIISFIILWIGLGVGFFRTIIAAVLVALLRWVLERVFGPGAEFLA